MSVRRLSALLGIAAVALALTACSSGSDPKPDSSSPSIDSTPQSSIEGEWTLTRTVTTSDDAANPAHAVAAVSTRAIQFADAECANGPCTGTVLSGPTAAVRDSTTFASAGDVIRYEFSGFVHCLRQDTGAVLVANGYAYTSTVELKVIATDAADATKATTLEGTMTYSDELTPEAIEAGCTRTPLTATTAFDLSAVRAAEPAATP